MPIAAIINDHIMIFAEIYSVGIHIIVVGFFAYFDGRAIGSAAKSESQEEIHQSGHCQHFKYFDGF